MFAATRFRIGGIAFLILALACAAAPAQRSAALELGAGAVQPVSGAARRPLRPVARERRRPRRGRPGRHRRGRPRLHGLRPRQRAQRNGLRVPLHRGADLAGPRRRLPRPRTRARPRASGPRWRSSATSVAAPTPAAGAARSGRPTEGRGARHSARHRYSSGAGVDQGAVYVLDGATRADAEAGPGSRPCPAQGTAGFGKSLVSLSGQPACERFGGLGPVRTRDDSAVALGDVNGGGQADFAVGAPDFAEDENTLEGVCVGVCPGSAVSTSFPARRSRARRRRP